MPRQRFFNLAPRTRERLLATATREFARRGFEGASLNEIIAKAGISKGAYYYYFDDKDDLFATTLESAVDSMLSRVPLPALAAVSPDEFWPTVERFVSSWPAALDSSHEILQLALQLTDAQRKSPRFAPLLAKGQTLYRALIEPGQRLGCVRTDLPVDTLVRLLETADATLDSLYLAKGSPINRRSLSRHFALVFDTFKRILVAEPFAPSTSPPPRGRRRG